MEVFSRDFKGIWIPKPIWLDKRLSALEKIIFAEIDSLDCEDSGCFASNEYLADFCQCSITKVSCAISKLIQLGLVYQQSFNGRTRILKSSLSNFERQYYRICKAGYQTLKAENIDDKNRIDNNSHSSEAVRVEDSKPKKHKYGKYNNVLLTEEEHATLIGMDNGDRAIEYLSEYREMKGYKAKSDYLAIKKWVFAALKEGEQRERRLQKSENSYLPNFDQRQYSKEELNACARSIDSLNEDDI